MDGLRELIFSQGLSADLCRLGVGVGVGVGVGSGSVRASVAADIPADPTPNPTPTPTCSYDGRTAMHCAAAGARPDA